MRVEGVHVEEEVAAGVLRKPVARRAHRPRAEGVRLAPAVPGVAQVLPDDLRVAQLLRRGGKLGLCGRGAPAIVLLPADPLPAREAAVVAVGVREDVRRVRDEHRGVARAPEDLGDNGGLARERLPARLDEGEAAGHDVHAVRHGREARGVCVLEDAGLLGEPVEVGRLHALAAVEAEVIAAHGVGDDEDDVHRDCLPAGAVIPDGISPEDAEGPSAARSAFHAGPTARGTELRADTVVAVAVMEGPPERPLLAAARG